MHMLASRGRKKDVQILHGMIHFLMSNASKPKL